MRDMVREGVRALGLELLVAETYASPTVTGVKVDDADQFRQHIRLKYGGSLLVGKAPSRKDNPDWAHGIRHSLGYAHCSGGHQMTLGRPGIATAAAERLWLEAQC